MKVCFVVVEEGVEESVPFRVCCSSLTGGRGEDLGH